MPTHPDGQHGKKANSPIQAKGVGKNSKRHDLDGTPGLSKGSSLVSGEVGQLERGQKQIQDTQQQQGAAAPKQNKPQAPPSNAEGQFAAPDPLEMAKKKIGGNLSGAGAGPVEETVDFGNWLPFLRRISASPTSSGLLQRAILRRMSTEMNRATGSKVALIRQRDFDQRLEQLNGSA